MKFNYLFIFLVFISTNLEAQTISSKIVDGKTKKPIPYVTIQYGENQGVISNEEGRFSFVIDSTTQKLDSIYISSMGYEKLGFTYENLLDSVIYVQPKAIELSGVYVFDKDLEVDEILEKVENNLEKNHGKSFLKKHFFLRQSYVDRLKRVDVNFKKSTIKELDKDLIDSTVNVIPRKSNYYTETLGNFYTNANPDGKNKVEIIKAAELYDKDNEISGEALQKKFEEILQKNVKQDSYLKIKSGWFSTKVQVDSILENSDDTEIVEEKEPEKTSFLPNRKYALKIMHERMFSKKTNLDIIKKSNRYEFKLKGYTEIQDAGVYVLDFIPKGRADFEGTLFVNVEDFAIMKVKYNNLKSLRKLKLLGFSYNQHTYKGSTVFTKTPTGTYSLKFATFESGNTSGVDRPLKIVEKNKNVKGRRKQNELKVDLDIVNESYSKYELVVFNISQSNKSTIDGITEVKNVKPVYLSKYNPEFWKGYNIMEPNQAIKEFTVSESN
jgi:hypothetical protein